MSEDSIIYRNTITIEDVDTEALEKPHAVVEFIKAPDNIIELADDEAMPTILDVATSSAVEEKENR